MGWFGAKWYSPDVAARNVWCPRGFEPKTSFFVTSCYPTGMTMATENTKPKCSDMGYADCSFGWKGCAKPGTCAE